jgi:hypothetical protein
MRAFLFLLSLTALPAVAVPYTLADLDVLARQSAYEEFFSHALDVRPSERNDQWEEMVSRMAQIQTSVVLRESAIKAQDFQKTEALFLWPSLRKDDVFKQKRQEIGLRYLKSCLKLSTSSCAEDMKNFWDKDPSDPDLGLKLSEMVETHPGLQIPAWPFLEIALKSPLSEFYCKKTFVMKNLWDKIEIDYIRLGAQGDLLKKIDQTAHPDCLPSLNAEARKRLHYPQSPDDREIAYRILESQSKVDQKTTDFFYTLYLLEHPSKGELFNYSWNRLKELGAAEPRREAVLMTIQRELKNLPDDVFASLDLVKRKAILTHFKNHFPEYLDYYARQCIQFYEGKGSHPNGNPTLNCQSFMASELAVQVLGESKVREFQKAKSI